MHKKIRVIFLIVVMLVTMVFGSNTVLAVGGVYISKYVANDNKDIDEGDTFTLNLTIKNDSSSKIENVMVTFGAGASFQPSSGGRDVPFAGEIAGDGGTENESFELFYTGDADKNLPITITYLVGGEEKSVSTSIYIRNAEPDDKTGDTGGNTGGGSVDTKEYQPVLEITSVEIPGGKAGGIINIPLTISNMSKYEAREVRITPELPENVFIVDQMTLSKTIEKIPANKSVTVNFQFKIEKMLKKRHFHYH